MLTNFLVGLGYSVECIPEALAIVPLPGVVVIFDPDENIFTPIPSSFNTDSIIPAFGSLDTKDISANPVPGGNKLLTKDELEECFSMENLLRNEDRIYERIGV